MSFLDETEARYFNIFQERTAREISGFFDSDVWSRSILQVCHEEGFARHAIIALGALYLTIDSVQSQQQLSFGPEDRWKIGTRHHEYALRQYGKALQLMRDIPEKKTQEWVRNTLISCLLTSCFETYIGNQDSALVQAQIGIDLLDMNQDTYCPMTSDNLGYSSSTPLHMDSDLVGIFARLESFVVMFKDNQQIPRNQRPLRAVPSAAFRSVPASFVSLKEAKYCWDLIITRSLRWRESFNLGETATNTFDWGEDLIRRRISCADDFARLIIEEMRLFDEKRLEWYRAFMPLFEKSRSRPGTNEFLGASVLKIQFLGSCITTELTLEQMESGSDRYLADFITIVDLARDVLQYLYSNSPSKAMFVFDSSLLVSLFLTSQKCRDRDVRRRAIGLLREYPRREGFWDSAMAASVGTWLMYTEEEGILTEHIPEAARLRIVRTYLRLDERKAVIVCSKLIEGTEEREDLPEVTVSW